MQYSLSIQGLVVCGMEPIQFDLKAKFNGVSLHWKYRPLRKGNGRYIHAGRIPSSHKHRGVLIAGWYRGQTIPPEFGEASVVGYYTEASPHEIGFVSRHVDTGSYNRICYSPEPTSSEKQHTTRKL